MDQDKIREYLDERVDLYIYRLFKDVRQHDLNTLTDLEDDFIAFLEEDR